MEKIVKFDPGVLIDEFASSAPEKRPWGEFYVLYEGTGVKIKMLLIKPMQKISLQVHQFRNEHWFILSGEALVTRENSNIKLMKGKSIDILVKELHRVENVGRNDLKIIEIQYGNILSELDIHRFDDLYGRLTRSLEST